MMTAISTQPKAPVAARTQNSEISDSPREPKRPPTLVDRIIDKTYLGGNYTASGLSGGIAGVAAAVSSAPGTAVKTTGSLYKNWVKAETVGINVKTLGLFVGAPAVAAAVLVGLPVSLIAGVWQGASQVDSSKPRQFTISSATAAGYNKTKEGWNSATKGALESLNHMGTEKLLPGEKPFDIPIIKTLKTVALGAAGIAVGGIVGVVSAVVGAARETAVGIGQAFSDESLGIPAKVLAGGGAIVGGVVHGATYGIATAATIFGHAVAETWEKDSLKEGAKSVIGEAKNSVLAAAAPQATLLRERITAVE